MTTVNRLLIMHYGSDVCLYDHIWSITDTKWQNDKDEFEEFDEIGPASKIAGTQKEQEQRTCAVKLLKAMYKFSISLEDLGGISKACFHTPSQTRATSFAPTYKPLFGTLPRPKQLVHPTLQSLVFNQNEQECVTARHKKLNLLAACFYGTKTNEAEAREFVQESLREFAHQFRGIIMTGDTSELLKYYEECDPDEEVDQEAVMTPFQEFDDFVLHFYDHQFQNLEQTRVLSGYFQSDKSLTVRFDDEPHVSFEISTEH